MYRMPARLVVAGVACLRSRISKIMRMCDLSGMRSFEASVSILLSSITEFIDSIQLASRSPSRMIHLGFSSGIWPRSRMMTESSPSFHSRVCRWMWPYRSSVGSTFGLRSTALTLLRGSLSPRALMSILVHADLPAPGGPITNTQWRIAMSSSSCVTLSVNDSSGHSPDSSHARCAHCARSSSTTRGGLSPGNRSFSSPKKTTSSILTILGTLKSRSARISSASSAMSGSARLSWPATTSTLLTARRPQS